MKGREMIAQLKARVLLTALALGLGQPCFAQDARAAPAKSLAHEPWPKGDPRGWISAKDFPASARGEHGATTYRLDIDAAGNINSCEIVASSGFSDLDQATCSLMSARGRFVPALDETGKPTAGTHVATIRWGG